MRFTDSTRRDVRAGTRLDFLWRRGRGRPNRRLLCFSEPRLPREIRGSGAYNPFFYAAAGLSFGNFLLVATMGWLERRAVAEERA